MVTVISLYVEGLSHFNGGLAARHPYRKTHAQSYGLMVTTPTALLPTQPLL